MRELGEYPKTLDRPQPLSEGELAVHAVLHDWFVAMESADVLHRLPDPDYVRPEGKAWTTDDLLTLCRSIDNYVWGQIGWVRTNIGEDYDAGPGYSLLPEAQQLAFAQDLERVLLKYPEPPPSRPADEPPEDVFTAV